MGFVGVGAMAAYVAPGGDGAGAVHLPEPRNWDRCFMGTPKETYPTFVRVSGPTKKCRIQPLKGHPIFQLGVYPGLTAQENAVSLLSLAIPASTSFRDTPLAACFAVVFGRPLATGLRRKATSSLEMQSALCGHVRRVRQVKRCQS